jgi:hypothetical protein
MTRTLLMMIGVTSVLTYEFSVTEIQRQCRG